MVKTAEKVIETQTIRLTADETRAIMKASLNPKGISDYRCCALVDLGLMTLVAVQPVDNTKAVAECWKRIRKHAAEEDRGKINSELQAITDLKYKASQCSKEKVYVLTDLGKSVARGVAVRLNGQFKEVVC